MLASLNTPGEMRIYAKRSRNHTELMFNNLNIPIEIKKKNIDFIKTSSPDILKAYNLNIPGDISSAAFFIVLTLLSKNSKLSFEKYKFKSLKIRYFKNFKKNGSKY